MVLKPYTLKYLGWGLAPSLSCITEDKVKEKFIITKSKLLFVYTNFFNPSTTCESLFKICTFTNLVFLLLVK